MVEIEISVLKAQCLDHRIPETETLQREVFAWQYQRNCAKATVNWVWQEPHPPQYELHLNPSSFGYLNGYKEEKEGKEEWKIGKLPSPVLPSFHSSLPSFPITHHAIRKRYFR